MARLSSPAWCAWFGHRWGLWTQYLDAKDSGQRRFCTRCALEEDRKVGDLCERFGHRYGTWTEYRIVWTNEYGRPTGRTESAQRRWCARCKREVRRRVP